MRCRCTAWLLIAERLNIIENFSELKRIVCDVCIGRATQTQYVCHCGFHFIVIFGTLGVLHPKTDWKRVAISWVDGFASWKIVANCMLPLLHRLQRENLYYYNALSECWTLNGYKNVHLYESEIDRRSELESDIGDCIVNQFHVGIGHGHRAPSG